jgi:hypothetical protein
MTCIALSRQHQTFIQQTFWTLPESPRQSLNILNIVWIVDWFPTFLKYFTRTYISTQKIVLSIQNKCRMFRFCSNNVQKVHTIQTIFRECSDFSDNVNNTQTIWDNAQNVQNRFRIFRQCSECSESSTESQHS